MNCSCENDCILIVLIEQTDIAWLIQGEHLLYKFKSARIKFLVPFCLKDKKLLSSGFPSFINDVN